MKNELVKQIKQLLDPRPEYAVFRHTTLDDLSQVSDHEGPFEYKGQLLTREQCRQIPAKKHIFIMRHIRST